MEYWIEDVTADTHQGYKPNFHEVISKKFYVPKSLARINWSQSDDKNMVSLCGDLLRLHRARELLSHSTVSLKQ